MHKMRQGRLVPDLFLFFNKAYYEVKESGLQISFNIFWYPQLGKNKPYKTLGYWFVETLNFNFSEKGLGLVSPPHFMYDFPRKLFFMLHSINCPNFIVWFPLLLVILDNMCILDNCLLTRLWRHKISNWPCLSYQTVLLHDQKVKTKT